MFYLPQISRVLRKRTVNEYTYKNPEDKMPRLRRGIKDYIEYYNNRRFHHGIDHHKYR